MTTSNSATAIARRSVAALSTLVLLVSSACQHVVEIDTVPTGGEVIIDGRALGMAPVRYVETTGWKRAIAIEASAPGYLPTRQEVVQSEWHPGITAGVAGCSLALCTPLTGLGAVPFFGLFFARQLPDRIVVHLVPVEATSSDDSRDAPAASFPDPVGP